MSYASKILVVDDEPDILNLLEYNLKKAGFSVITAQDGPEAIDMASAERPDLILLDIMLPNMEGTEVLRRLKALGTTSRIPVIMLTAKGEEIDKVVGFELGAEDYITKPFSPREVVLRARAVLKRAGDGATAQGGEGVKDVTAFKELVVDRARHRVTVGGAEVALSTKEFDLLGELVASRGLVLTRDTLLDRVWGHECYVIPRTVDTHIRRLRVKLKEAGGYIETVRGVGYRFAER